MSDDISESKEFIIKKLEGSVEKMENAQETVNETIKDFRFVKTRLSENIHDAKLNIEVWSAISSNHFSNPSSQLTSLTLSATGLSKDFYEQSMYLKKKIEEQRDLSRTFVGTLVSSSTMNSTMKAIALDTAKLLSPVDPKIERIIKKIEAPSTSEQSRIISSKLKTIAPRLAEKFDAAWQTVEDTNNPDRFRQAAHSMREVLSDFLQALAPDNRIKETEWYKKLSLPKPTQEIRTKYAIIGRKGGKAINKNNLRAINKLMEVARRTYKDLSKIAHARNKSSESLFPLTESYLLNCQNIINGILELRETFFKS